MENPSWPYYFLGFVLALLPSTYAVLMGGGGMLNFLFIGALPLIGLKLLNQVSLHNIALTYTAFLISQLIFMAPLFIAPQWYARTVIIPIISAVFNISQPLGGVATIPSLITPVLATIIWPISFYIYKNRYLR